MKIDHLAIWTNDIEGLKDFYVKYFSGTPNEKYINEKKNYQSYFISFESGARLEIMQMPGTPNNRNHSIKQNLGLIHLAFSVGSRSAVDELTQLLKTDGYQVIDGPRQTGDGYYESVVLDPDKNRVEVTV